MVILGLDPDKGWAFVRYHKIVSAGTVKGMAALKKIISDVGTYARNRSIDLLVRIEKPTNLKVFPRPGLSQLAMLKVARNVGQNYEKAESLGRLCASLGLSYEFCAPARKKITARELKQMTGFTRRTSQHARDAIVLALR